MRNLSFRGYAQSKGFDPLQVPDETWKMQDETERTLRGMREVRSQNLQNRNEQLDTLKSNARKEEQQRNVNQGLKEEFSKAYHDAEMQHYKTRILDQDTKIREAKLNYDRFKDLQELAPKAVTALAQFQQQRFTNIMGKGQSLGLTLQEQLGTEEYDRVLDEIKKGRTLREVMRERHPSYKDTVDKSLNAWELIAVQRHTARNDIKSTIAPEYAKYAETNVRDGLTINQRKLDENTVDGAAINVQLDEFAATIKKKYLDAGFSPSFVNKELGSIIDDFVGTERKALNVQVGKNKTKQVYETRGKDIIELWREGGQAIVDPVDAVNDKKATLDEYFHYAEYFAGENDEYGSDFFDPILDQPVIIQGKETTLRQKYPTRAAGIDKAIASRRKKADEQHKIYVENSIAQANQAVFDTGHAALQDKGYALHPSIYKKVVDNLLNGENVSMKDLRSSSEGMALLDGMNRPLEEYNTDILNNWAKQKEERNGVFTLADIMIPTISPEQRQKLFPKTLEGRGLPGDFDKTVTSGLRKQMKIMAGSKTETDIHSPQIDLLMTHAKKDFYKHMFKFFDEHDAENIIDKESLGNAALTDYLSSMSKDTGLYKSEGLGQNFKYSFFDTVAEDLAEIKTINMVSDNPALLSEVDTLTDSQDLQIINYGLNGGDTPKILEALDRQLPNLDRTSIVNMRLKANGKKEIERKGIDNLHSAVDPEFSRLMTNMPSLAKTFRALNLSLEKSGDMSEGDVAMYEALITKDIGSQFNEPYEVVRTPNGLKEASEMGMQLESTTVSQAMNMLNSGMAASIGAFDLNVASIQRAKAKGLISDEDTLTAGMQLAIFRNDKAIDIGTFIIDGMDEPLVGVGQYNTLPFNYKQRKKGRGRGISQKQATDRFNKNIKNLVKFVDNQVIGSQMENVNSIPQEFLFDRIRQSIQANKAKVESGELEQTSRGLRPTETRKVVEETKSNIFAADFALKGFNYYQFTDDMRQELESD